MMLVPLLIISACNGIGTPLLACHRTVQEYNKLFKSSSLQIKHTLVYAKQESSNIMCRPLTTKTGYPGMLQFQGDLNSLPACIDHMFSSSAWPVFLSTVVIIFLYGIPCQSISQASRLTTRRSFGLHAMPSRLWHVAHATIYKLTVFLPESCLFTLSENVIPGNEKNRNELGLSVGFEKLMCSEITDGTTRPRLAWASVNSDLLLLQPFLATLLNSPFPGSTITHPMSRFRLSK